MRRISTVLVLTAALLALSGTAAAGDSGRRIAVSAGAFNFSKSETVAEAGLELRVPLSRFGLYGAGGFNATEDSSYWAWAGVQRPVPVGRRWAVVPGFGVALYEEGDGKDLGGVVEFRSSLEVALELGRRAQLGVMVYHLSNAGLYDLNPGSNSAVLVLSFPVGR